LRHCRRLIAHQDCIQTVKFISTSGEARDARRHPNEGTRRRPCGERLTLGCCDHAALAFLSIGDAYKVLKYVVSEQPFYGHVLATQNNDVTLL
jgi:hypothetical protein